MPDDVEVVWEYGFYDSETGPNPIWWYTFGGLVGFDSVDAAQHTASKSVWGQAVIVRRTHAQAEARNVGGPDEWEHVESDG